MEVEDIPIWKTLQWWFLPSYPADLDPLAHRYTASDEDVKMVFYANAGHSFHYGDMKPISRNKGGKSTTAFLGVGEGVLDKYTEDMFAFIQSRMVK